MTLLLTGCISSANDSGSNGHSDGNQATAGPVSLSWQPPQSRQNGDDLPPSEIKHYEVRWGTASNQYTEVAETIDTQLEITNLKQGETYYFVVKVWDNQDRDSRFSEERSVTLN